MTHCEVIHCLPGRVPGNLAHMRRAWVLLIALLEASPPAFAQVTVDLHALDALPGGHTATHAPPKHTAPARRPARKQRAAKSGTSSPQQATTAPPGGTAAGPSAAAPPGAAPVTGQSPPTVTLPQAPPPTVALAPIPLPSGPEPAPPPTPPVSATSTSAAVPSTGGLQVTFGSGQTDLSPASAAAIQGLVKSAPASGGASFNVVAYAAGTPEDPSTARRLSLSRALAVRSALMANGVSSSRIFVRALGAKEGDTTPDRVDLAVLGANAPADATSAKP